jgi:DNA repair protein RadC
MRPGRLNAVPPEARHLDRPPRARTIVSTNPGFTGSRRPPRSRSPPAADDDKEHFWAIFVNAQNHYLMHTLVSTGTQSASLVHPREVLRPALRVGAAALILVHNHPSGDPTPSREDLRLTHQLFEGAQLLDLRLHDRLIIGNGTERWVSLAQRGTL